MPEQRDVLIQDLASRFKERDVAGVFGAPAKRGSIYRWGVSTSLENSVPDRWDTLSQLAVSRHLSSKRRGGIDPAELSLQLENLERPQLDVSDLSEAVVLAAALPALCDTLDPDLLWQALTTLQDLRNRCSQFPSSRPEFLIGRAELGLHLAWCFSSVPSCHAMMKSSLDAVQRWCDLEDESIAHAVTGARNARLVLASLCRCELLIENVAKRKFKRQQQRVAADLTVWVAAQTRRGGASVFSQLDQSQIKDDLGPTGLLNWATRFDVDSLKPAIQASLGVRKSDGKLAFQVGLPESMVHDEDAKLACMMADWDVARGRTTIDYSQSEMRIETHAGNSLALSGSLDAQISIDGDDQRPTGEWVSNCEYSDDDVHYLELEQAWSSDVILQRQFLLIRDDRILLTSDCVLQGSLATHTHSSNSHQEPGHAPRQIEWLMRYPTMDALEITEEPDTRELFLADAKSRVLAIPLSANEWRVGPTDASLRVSEDGRMVLTSRGNTRLYAPLWLDFSRKRFRRQRTWRQLTVADERRICGADEAVGYRLQVGSEQWMIYRSMAESKPRTVLGKHFIADFYCARFDTGDGSMEDLVTVDDRPSE